MTLVAIGRRLQAASDLIGDCAQGLDSLAHRMVMQEQVDRQLGELDEDKNDELGGSDSAGGPVWR